MKKGLFILGLLLLLLGVIYSQPADDVREYIDKVEYEEVHNNLVDNYNSSHEQLEDRLGSGDNLEYASYGVLMLGLLLMIVSVMKRKDKGSGLLYQKGDKQHISPKDLEKSLTKSDPPPPDLPPSPILPVGSTSPGITPANGPSSPAPANGASSNDLFELPTLGSGPSSTGSTPSVFGTVPMDPTKEYSLFCPNCGQGFSVKGAIKTVICPRCGKRFDTDRARKA